jgi:hypothetical protein
MESAKESGAVEQGDEFAQFRTREVSNEGILLPLNSASGEPTEHWLRVRGVDSDAFRLADVKSRRRAMEIAQEGDETKRDEMVQEVRLDVLVALIASWSFKRELTPENVKAFLRDAPQIAEGVDKAAYRRALFFAKSSKPSSTTQGQASS